MFFLSVFTYQATKKCITYKVQLSSSSYSNDRRVHRKKYESISDFGSCMVHQCKDREVRYRIKTDKNSMFVYFGTSYMKKTQTEESEVQTL